MSKPESIFRKEILGWSLYDFANTIYSMNIVSLYLKRYIVEDLHKDHLYFDIPFSLSMIFAAILLPALGAISDHSAKKKIFVMLFTLTCCISVGVMAFIPSQLLIIILILFIIANFCYEAAQPFYNSLLYSVSDGNQARFVSGIGVALGYVGSVVGMIIVRPFVTGKISIPFFESGGFTASFIPTAILFLIFSFPLYFWVKEKENIKKSKIKFISAYKEVWEGIKETKKYPGVLRFLIADYFFEDAVTTVILNIGIYCSVVIGFE
ncbi:MAG: MFS transporter, partial [candidate division Zixibacteria bacterium]|nr:MFS transporter [candidate division Zixibacteria bacterium]